ncbi:MAG: DUF192 domain-containing protein, partial [Acidimicrobiales bacterium]
DGPADPVLAPARGDVPAAPAAGMVPAPACASLEDRPRAPLEGFGEVGFRVTAADGSTAFEGCALLAASPGARAQGLMAQEDLRGYDAMVFRFDEASTGGFYMFRTVLPLSIAFVGEDGGLVSTADMDPCPETEASACPTYRAAGPYRHAVEVVQGDLSRLGIVPGATVTFEGTPP